METGERFVNTMPTEQEMGKKINGVTWGQFRQMSDAELEALKQDITAEVMADADALLPDPTDEAAMDRNDHEKMRLLGQMFTFHQFASWKRFGVPDRAVSHNDMEDRMRHMVAARLEVNPAYGRTAEVVRAPLQVADAQIIGWLMQYFADRRDPFEYPSLDEYSLGVTIGLDVAEVTRLLELGVLESGQAHQKELESAVAPGPTLSFAFQDEVFLTRPAYDSLLLSCYGPAELPPLPPEVGGVPGAVLGKL